MMLNINQEACIRSLLTKGIRMDGREGFRQRAVEIQFMDESGHLMYCQGKTKILVKTYPELTAPHADHPSQGFLIFHLNCQASSHTQEQNKKLTNEITKLLEKVIIGSGVLELESLCVLSGKYVWEVKLEIVVVTDDGGLVDAVLNAGIAALMDMRKPMVQMQGSKVQMVGEKQQMLSLAHTPISFTFGLLENGIILDPSLKEQLVCQSRITITMNIYKEICSMHKLGGMGMSEKVLSGTISVCHNKIKPFVQHLRQLIAERKSIRSYF